MRAAFVLAIVGLVAVLGAERLAARVAELTRERDAARAEVQVLTHAVRGTESAATGCTGRTGS